MMSQLWSSKCKFVGTTVVNTKPVSEASGYLITSLGRSGETMVPLVAAEC